MVLRVGLAVVAVQLMQIIGLTLAGGILLLWVSWRFWRDISGGHKDIMSRWTPTPRCGAPSCRSCSPISPCRWTMCWRWRARRVDHLDVLVIGLLMSVALMGAAANLIARLLERFRWISYLGLAIVIYVALSMVWSGSHDVIEALT